MTGWLGSPHKKPSDIMLDVLTGKLHHNDAPEAVQSMCMLQYYHAAEQLLGLPKEKRKKALQRIPETCRYMVEAETIRLWRLSK